MTGIGGVFPNYEDHLLDKKKISECFDGNFHEVLYPLNYTSRNGSIILLKIIKISLI